MVCWMPVTSSTTSMMPVRLGSCTIGTDAFGTVTTTSAMGGQPAAIPGASTINNAIAGTDPGGTVNLLQGTYTETVTIDKVLP